mmetsp:Transcript_5389/g.22808  ORF Transcript_5389/g.22808 Transcript_5389/m.22808 type:complete len:240 (-) Transcript_5389:1270-1989(-)
MHPPSSMQTWIAQTGADSHGPAEVAPCPVSDCGPNTGCQPGWRSGGLEALAQLAGSGGNSRGKLAAVHDPGAAPPVLGVGSSLAAARPLATSRQRSLRRQAASSLGDTASPAQRYGSPLDKDTSRGASPPLAARAAREPTSRPRPAGPPSRSDSKTTSDGGPRPSLCSIARRIAPRMSLTGFATAEASRCVGTCFHIHNTYVLASHGKHAMRAAATLRVCESLDSGRTWAASMLVAAAL